MECEELLGKSRGKNIRIELGGTKDSKKASGYYVIKTNGILEIDSFENVLNVFEQVKKEYMFRRLSAERNIVPEKEMDLYLSNTGEGASNLVRVFLNDSSYKESIIEELLLKALNEIMYPEAEFESIRVQHTKKSGENVWEIYLKEKGRERVPLSKSGSGIKTIILVLLNLIVVPKQPQILGRQ